METFSGNPCRQPMINVIETSPHFISFPQKIKLKDASSFSSYLRPEATKAASGENIGCSVDDSDQISIFDAESYFNEGNNEQKADMGVPSGVDNASLDGPTEICEYSIASRLSSVSSVDGYGRNNRAQSFHAKPTASSEASWNSQTGLLSNPPGTIAVSFRNLPADNQKRGGHRIATKWFLGRKCPCSGKKSVQIKEKRSEPGIPSPSYPKRQSPRSVDQSLTEKQFAESQRSLLKQNVVGTRRPEKVIPNLRPFSSQNHFTSSITHHHHHHRQVLGSFNDGTAFSFPILNQSSKFVLKGIPTSYQEDPPRDSLEVFQPTNEPISSKSMEVPRRALVSHAGVDRDCRDLAFRASLLSRITATDEDVASDASSDLFEIESFSTQPSSYPMYRRRDSLDEATTFNARRLAAGANGDLYCRRSLDESATPSVAVTECYEPSEASVDWSVTTAEGFDRASVTNLSITASDIEDLRIIRHEVAGGISGSSGGGAGRGDASKWRSGNGLLLSCRCEKAVSVGPHPVKCIQQEGPRAARGPPLPLISTTRHVSGDSASRPHNVHNKPPLPMSRSTRLSLAFAT